MPSPTFGVQRLVRQNSGALDRMVFHAMGVADPAHYLHHRYLRQALDAAGIEPRQILDAGCGTGDHTIYLAQRFPNAAVVGVDIDEQRVARNRKNAELLGIRNVTFEVQDLTALPWRDRFDLVVSIDVLEHITEQQRAIESLFGSLRKGGRFFFHLPTIRQKPVPFSSHLTDFQAWAEKEHIADDRTAEEFIAVVRNSGFAIESSRRTFGWFTGELATSLFALPHRNTTRNRIMQGILAPVCRALVLADRIGFGERYAVAVAGKRPE
jgi:ubiquinone/menaquinone biosynthesis C-methylase UbiE